MFTGIVQQLATVRARTLHGEDIAVRFGYGVPTRPPLGVGDSISINGVCLTASTVDHDYFETDISAQTLGCTTLGELGVGQKLNMECALVMGAPLGGHVVSGHVDAVARVRAMRAEGRSYRFEFGFDEAQRSVLDYVVPKGSVAVDGVSLTVVSVDESGFGVNIVPHTMESTVFSDYVVDTGVNVEADVLARYVARTLGK